MENISSNIKNSVDDGFLDDDANSFLPKIPQKVPSKGFGIFLDDDDDDFKIESKKVKPDICIENKENKGVTINSSINNGIHSVDKAGEAHIAKFKTLDEILYAIDNYQQESGTNYFIRKTDKEFGKVFDLKGHTILFEDIKQRNSRNPPGPKLEFTGIPFIIVGKKLFECTHGTGHHKAVKEKKLSKRKDNMSDFNFQKNRYLTQNSKKMNCPSRIMVRDIVFFPDFKIKKNTIDMKKRMCNKLKSQFEEKGVLISHERCFVANFPSLDSHNGHFIGGKGGLSQNIDNRISDKIRKLVGDGVRDVREMKRHIEVFVKHEIFRGEALPARSSRQYFPTKVDIRNHMYRASMKLKFSKLDQDNLEHNVQEWAKQRPNDNFFFQRLW